MNSAEIRRHFRNYYRRLGFHQLPQAPMLHSSIPMSFVMSAGLVQIETALAETQARSGDKFLLVQDCFRQFDLEKVGTDNYHLSLFEMPGAFVFCSNGKSGTIRQMWNLANSVLGIDRDHIWVSYFAGGAVQNNHLQQDIETRQAWIDIGMPENRVVGLGVSDNYWVQGGGIDGIQVSRKCGPNTELFYDLGSDKGCGSNCRPGCKCGRFLEFANSLFISRELNLSDHCLRPIAEPFTETVIGTERVAMIKQRVRSVFEIDDFRPLVQAIDSFVQARRLPESLKETSEHIIADHLKALYFLVANDAPPPGKDGRRRIIKLLIRGVVARMIILGIDSDAFVTSIISRISQTVHNPPGASIEQEKRLESYFDDESLRFRKSLERGHRQLLRLLKENEGCTLSGDQIVSLEKNWGLPWVLCEKKLRELDLYFAEEEYKDALENWKEVSSASS